MRETDLAVIGGGAAGMAAAIWAAQAAPGIGIVVFDAAPIPGAKIRASGGGRCNITHDEVTPEDFVPSSTFVRNVLRSFTVEQTRDWFASMGVPTISEADGRVFPTSNEAEDVVNALRKRMDELGIQVTNQKATSLRRLSDGRFEVGETAFRRVIVATGGCSMPATGTDGSFAREIVKLGHTLTPWRPALTPLLIKENYFTLALSGVSCHVALEAWDGTRKIGETEGPMLLTHFGISGPAVLNLSHHFTRKPGMTLFVNFLPAVAFGESDRWILSRIKAAQGATVATLLAKHLPRRLVDALLEFAIVVGHTPACRLTSVERNRVREVVFRLELPVTGYRGWSHAEVSAGGIPLEEVSPATMGSKRVPGLFLAGEILDCFGRMGGFNFQWAWATGRTAGISAARAIARGAG